jgi:hypothetical protein
MKMIAIPFSQFGKVHQYKEIAAGESGRVYYLKIPDSCVGFIQQVANNYFDNTYLVWKIDGATVENKIERMIGKINNPKEFNPPFLVQDKIEFWAYNNDTIAHTFEVVCDGVAYMRKVI